MISNLFTALAIVHLCSTGLSCYWVVLVAQIGSCSFLNNTFEHLLYRINCLARTNLLVDYIRFVLLNHLAPVRKSFYKHRTHQFAIICNGIVECKHLQWSYRNLISVCHLRQRNSRPPIRSFRRFVNYRFCFTFQFYTKRLVKVQTLYAIYEFLLLVLVVVVNETSGSNIRRSLDYPLYRKPGAIGCMRIANDFAIVIVNTITDLDHRFRCNISIFHSNDYRCNLEGRTRVGSGSRRQVSNRIVEIFVEVERIAHKVCYCTHLACLNFHNHNCAVLCRRLTHLGFQFCFCNILKAYVDSCYQVLAIYRLYIVGRVFYGHPHVPRHLLESGIAFDALQYAVVTVFQSIMTLFARFAYSTACQFAKRLFPFEYLVRVEACTVFSTTKEREGSHLLVVQIVDTSLYAIATATVVFRITDFRLVLVLCLILE